MVILMDISFLIRGVVLGVSIAAPVGPIGVLCIRRTLVYGQWAGLVSGLGAATADGIYGCIAGFGLSVVGAFLVDQSGWMRLIGGLFLCYLGVQTVLATPAVEMAIDPSEASGQTSTRPFQHLISMYFSTLVLTIANPMTILSFTAVFAGVGLVQSQVDYGDSALLVLGVFLGSALWWLCLSWLVWGVRSRFNFSHLRSLNYISGVVLLAFGMVALFSLQRS
jgi:threonine/homoserine/homoserine lactone efflux protein